MKGIILAAGKGTRLYPATMPVCKPLITVYDKPLIYYPLSLLMMAGIDDVLIIVPPGDMEPFIRLLDDGEELGIHISYKEQKVQRGIADAFIVGKRFIGNDSVCLALGDNIFYGGYFSKNLKDAVRNAEEGNATIFGYYVKDPERFGIVEFDENRKVISVEEKPKNPKSNYCITGLYFYPRGVAEKAKAVKPSARGELEITDLNRLYLEDGLLKAQILGRGFAWVDTGTMDSLIDAGSFIQTIQNRQGIVIAALEEIAYHAHWITKDELLESARIYGKSPYGEHLHNVANNKYLY